MDATWGNRRATELLETLGRWLQSEQARDRWHTMLATSAGELAVLAELPSVLTTVAEFLRLAPGDAFYRGVISNIPDLTPLIIRQMPTRTKAEDAFPLYSGEKVRKTIDLMNEPHIKLVLVDDIPSALAVAGTDLAREEVASTCAVLGRVPTCIAITQQPDFAQDRVAVPLMAACVETFRAGAIVESARILDQLLSRYSVPSWLHVQVSAGLLGRQPWAGYPYSEF